MRRPLTPFFCFFVHQLQGFYSPYSGQTACYPCDLGQYQQLPGASSCALCINGQLNPSLQQASCVDCPAGTRGNGTGQAYCPNCLAGTFNPLEGAVVCELCAPGTSSQAGQPNCVQCGTGTIAKDPGSAFCTPCESSAVSNFERTECLCNPGFYLPDTGFDLPGFVFRCEECPLGADCKSYGTRFSSLRALPGFWRATNETLNFYRCQIGAQCTGGLPLSNLFTATSGTNCAPNRIGPLW
jgi:hypothetical protein